MFTLSEKFLNAVREHGPIHKLAWAAGLTPNQVYKITAGVDRPGPDDPRIVALCKFLGLSPSDAFQGNSEASR